ncbi:ribonucleoside-diphosphate reductase small subunit [Pacmanvirus S19]|nr:ribonucleoside-diphosphate reductase small subunit [Pacmanvirus S19]
MPSQSQPIKLYDEDSRLTTFPIQRKSIWAYYKDSTKCYWTPEELNTSTDVQHYESVLTNGERHFVNHVLAFFAASDGIVNINLAKRFKKDIPILEVGYFYDFQTMIENIHAETYSILMDSIIPNQKEKTKLLNAVQTMPIIKKMSDYMFKCIDSTASLAERLLRMACVEGIFFTGCFCAIYWLQQRGLMPALSHSNEMIARDEALHTMFAMFMYTMIEKEFKLTNEQIKTIITEAVDLAKEFINEALPINLPGMNAVLMGEYIECQADNLVTLIDCEPIYGSKHEFGFMEQLNLTNRTNFFERRVSEYSKADKADSDEIADDF